MLMDLQIDENGKMKKDIITDIIGNNKQTIINRLKTLIIKTFVFNNELKQMCSERIIDPIKRELELEFAIKNKLVEMYHNDAESLQYLMVNVFIKESTVWIFFYYQYSETEKLFVFDNKIKL